MLLFTLAFAGSGHLFILSGQSNMERWDPTKKFMPAVRKGLKKDEVWHVKVAHGGKPIHFWVPEWYAMAEAAGIRKVPDPLDGPYLKEIRSAIRAEKRGPPDTVTLVWVQGEADARRGWSAPYGEALTTLVATLEDDLGKPLNVVVGRLSDFRPVQKDARESWAAVRETQKAFGTGKRRAWVDADDLNDLGSKKKPLDDLHYSKKGYKIFARRLAAQALALVRGTRPARTGRP